MILIVYVFYVLFVQFYKFSKYFFLIQRDLMWSVFQTVTNEIQEALKSNIDDEKEQDLENSEEPCEIEYFQ